MTFMNIKTHELRSPKKPMAKENLMMSDVLKLCHYSRMATPINLAKLRNKI